MVVSGNGVSAEADIMCLVVGLGSSNIAKRLPPQTVLVGRSGVTKYQLCIICVSAGGAAALIG